MQHQRLPNETMEHYELFLMFCEFDGGVEKFYNAIKPPITLSAVQKIASPSRNNWLARKKSFIEFSNSSVGLDIVSIKNNLLNRIKQLTDKPEMINMQNIEVLTNCFYKLTLIDCETKTEVVIEGKPQKCHTVKNNSISSQNISKKNENATVATVSNIFEVSPNMGSENQKPTQLPKESDRDYELFLMFCEFMGSIRAFADKICKKYNLKQKGVIAIGTKNKWTARKKEFLENKQ